MAMQAALEMKAQTRARVGTGAAREARRQGLTPVNLYAAGQKNQAIAVETRVISNEYFRGGFMNKIVSFEIEGKKSFAIAREIQLNPVSDKIEHADFVSVTEKSVVKVKVPVHFVNVEKSLGIKRGGALNIVRHDVELLAPVTAIPKAIDIDMLELNIGDSVHINNVKLPEGVKPALSRNFTIASIAGRNADEPEAATGAPVAGAVPASTAKAPADAAAPAKDAKK